MCGRTAQTRYTATIASKVLGAEIPSSLQQEGNNKQQDDGPVSDPQKEPKTEGEAQQQQHGNNYNLSPGMDAWVIVQHGDNNCSSEGGESSSQQQLTTRTLTWGLVTRSGTSQKPLSRGMSKHFEGLMFNARSDTLWERPTFLSLLKQQRTAVIAVDGFFEWKKEIGKVKQPYFVSSSYRPNTDTTANNESKQEKGSYLLLAGLWTRVKTGWKAEEDSLLIRQSKDDPSILETFTLLTTEASSGMKWLHHRMPVFIWDNDLALQWLLQPSRSVHEALVQDAADRDVKHLQWHAVTPKMSNVKFRDAAAIAPLPKVKSVKDFFGPAAKGKVGTTTTTKNTGGKHATKLSADTLPVGSKKRPSPFVHDRSKVVKKRGPMDAFLSSKNN